MPSPLNLCSARLHLPTSLLKTPLSVRRGSTAHRVSKAAKAAASAVSAEKRNASALRLDEITPFEIKGLLRALYPYVEAGKPGLALLRFQTMAGNLNNSNRFQAYESAISLFLRHGFALAAEMMHSRMIAEGFIPSESVCTQMFIIGCVPRAPSAEELLVDLRAFFSRSSFDERCLRDVLHLLTGTMNSGIDFVDEVVALFVDTRGDPGYMFSEETTNLLVRLHARLGSAASACRWAAGGAQAVSEGAGSRSSTSEPPGPQGYTTLLRDLASKEVTSTTYRWVIKQIQEHGVEPDLAFCNAVIANEVARYRFDNAFRVYGLLLNQSSPAFLPDTYTFVSLFRALRMLQQPRSARTRTYGRPDVQPSARALYRDMLHCHAAHPAGRSPVITADALHAALRAFLQTYDYPAAFVVLRTFCKCNVPLSARTYRIVLANLISRVRAQLPAATRINFPGELWAYRFMGSPPRGAIHGLHLHATEAILQFSAVSRLSLRYMPPQVQDEATSASGSSPSTPSPNSASRHRVPSAVLIAEMEHTLRNIVWDSVPLERILRRAILAQSPYLTTTPAKAVSEAVAAAKADMFDNSDQKRQRGGTQK